MYSEPCGLGFLIYVCVWPCGCLRRSWGFIGQTKRKTKRAGISPTLLISMFCGGFRLVDEGRIDQWGAGFKPLWDRFTAPGQKVKTSPCAESSPQGAAHRRRAPMRRRYGEGRRNTSNAHVLGWHKTPPPQPFGSPPRAPAMCGLALNFKGGSVCPPGNIHQPDPLCQKRWLLAQAAHPPEINLLLRSKTIGKTFAVLSCFCPCAPQIPHLRKTDVRPTQCRHPNRPYPWPAIRPSTSPTATATASSMLISEVSSKTASPAAFNGAAARALSRASR